MDGGVFQTVGLAFGRKTGFEREGAIRTYSRRLFVISESELETLALEKEHDRRLGRFWRESSIPQGKTTEPRPTIIISPEG